MATQRCGLTIHSWSKSANQQISKSLRVKPSMEIAQFNVAAMLAPIHSPALADFVAELERINQLAEASQGFVWRAHFDLANPTAIARRLGSNMVINLSVWSSIDELHTFTYRTAHAEVMSKRSTWFSQQADACSVLWWVQPDHRPTLLEAKQRLDALRQHGPSETAFTFKKRFAMPTDR